MPPVVKRFLRGEEHPPGYGVFCSDYRGIDAHHYLISLSAAASTTKSVFLSLSPRNHGVRLAEDAWVLVWEGEDEEENEFGRVMP